MNNTQEPIVYSDGFTPEKDRVMNPHPLPTEECGYCGATEDDEDNYGVTHPHHCRDKNCTVVWSHLVQECTACDIAWVVRPVKAELANAKMVTPCNQWYVIKLEEETKRKRMVGLVLILFGLSLLVLAGIAAVVILTR